MKCKKMSQFWKLGQFEILKMTGVESPLLVNMRLLHELSNSIRILDYKISS